MKKLIPICIVGILFFTAFGAATPRNEVHISNVNDGGMRDFTHTVFVEYGSTTSCPHCPYVHNALKTFTTEDGLPSIIHP